ncbi:hypothetical protein N7486_007593 [Penicillium sp. IBT 16267x]|nr:hypothetical protein N7486_007593 [Penicillium sp. IBT 16267x]
MPKQPFHSIPLTISEGVLRLFGAASGRTSPGCLANANIVFHTAGKGGRGVFASMAETSPRWFLSHGIHGFSLSFENRATVDTKEHEKRVELNIEKHGSPLALFDIYIILGSSNTHPVIQLSCRRSNLNSYLDTEVDQ